MERSCELCGKTFTSTKSWARFCSARCANKAWRQRNPERSKALRVAWVQRNPERYKAIVARTEQKNSPHLRKYGITRDEWNALHKAQNGRCAICHCELKPGYSTHTDHVVIDGRPLVRGILCRGCNQGLGMFGENPATLERAAEYLRRV